MDLEKNVIEIAEKLNINFWEEWSESTMHFPDNEDGWDLQLLIIQVAFATIITRYLLGFQSYDRCEELEKLISDFRIIECNLREID